MIQTYKFNDFFINFINFYKFFINFLKKIINFIKKHEKSWKGVSIGFLTFSKKGQKKGVFSKVHRPIKTVFFRLSTKCVMFAQSCRCVCAQGAICQSWPFFQKSSIPP